jgi:small GTP-binding protein
MKTADKLEKISDICRSNNIKALENDIDSLKKLLGEEQFINIAVLGQFKAGKSSFINSILGQKILPTGIVPVTNVVTIVENCQNLEVFVYFTDNTVKKIMPEQLKYWISEEENSKNQKNVKKVIIKYPLDFDADIRLIDTPGLNSVFEHNSQETIKWLPNIGVSLILISATNPLSKNDIELIKTAMEYSPEVFIIISKIDLLSSEETEKMKVFFANQLKKEFNKDFVIFLHSYNTSEYTQKILKYLKEHIDLGQEGMQKIIEHKFQRIKIRCTDFLQLKKQVILKKTETKDELKNKIFDEKLNINLIKKELMLIEKDYAIKIRENIKKYLLENFKRPIRIKLQTEFDEKFRNQKGNLNKLTTEYQKWIKTEISKNLKEISANQIDYNFFLEEAKNHFEFYLNSFKQRLNDKIFEVLQIRMKNEDIKIQLKPIKQPNTHISWAFDTKIELLWFLIPMFIFRKAFLKHFRNQIFYEVEKNLYRFTSELSKNIVDELKRMSDFVVKYIDTEISTIENILTNNTNEYDIVENQLQQIKQF